MTKLVIIRGAPGSGKTTLAKAKFPAYHHYEADMYFQHGSEYVFDRNKLKDAHEWCYESVRNSLSSGYNTVVSNTFTKVWEMQRYIDLAIRRGYELEIITATGNFGNVHGVPDDVVQRMKNNFEPYSHS